MAVRFDPVGPEMGTVPGVDQLNIDSDLVSGPPHAAFEQMADAELASDLLILKCSSPSVKRPRRLKRGTCRDLGAEIARSPLLAGSCRGEGSAPRQGATGDRRGPNLIRPARHDQRGSHRRDVRRGQLLDPFGWVLDHRIGLVDQTNGGRVHAVSNEAKAWGTLAPRLSARSKSTDLNAPSSSLDNWVGAAFVPGENNE